MATHLAAFSPPGIPASARHVVTARVLLRRCLALGAVLREQCQRGGVLTLARSLSQLVGPAALTRMRVRMVKAEAMLAHTACHLRDDRLPDFLHRTEHRTEHRSVESREGL